MNHATAEALAKLPSPREMMGIDASVVPKPTAGFVNVYGLVDDGRSAEQMIKDYLAAQNGDSGPASMYITRGPRAYALPEIEVATEILKSLDALSAEGNLPVEERMRNDIASISEELEYAMALLRQPRNVRRWADDPRGPEELNTLMSEAAGTMEMALLTLGNWTRNERDAAGNRTYDRGRARDARNHKVWAKLLEIRNRYHTDRRWEKIETAPTDAWILLKSMVGRPMIVRSASDTLAIDGNTHLVFSDTHWFLLSGETVQINAHGATWMPIEQPNFDAEGRPSFSL